jgi:hypothetical protein
MGSCLSDEVSLARHTESQREHGLPHRDALEDASISTAPFIADSPWLVYSAAGKNDLRPRRALELSVCMSTTTNTHVMLETLRSWESIHLRRR